LRPGDDPVTLARDAEANILGVAGGDGSLAAVAAVAVERDLPFVCVPYGTRNHFARDLGLDRTDPIAALDAFDGSERPIDVGRVNGVPFLNNVSLGIYARLVHRRERQRRRREALARLRALWLAGLNPRRLSASVDGVPVSARAILVANNAYELALFSVGERARLDEGKLYVYVARGVLPNDWDTQAAETLTVDVRPGVVAAAIDGEPAELESPLRFAVEPRALRILLPAARMAATDRGA
jgi:diacylglycerol kinase family enzyme